MTAATHLNQTITVTSQWTRWRLKSLASRLFAQPFVQAQITETSKLRVTGLCEENLPVADGSPHRGPVARKIPFDDVIILAWQLADSSPSRVSYG